MNAAGLHRPAQPAIRTSPPAGRREREMTVAERSKHSGGATRSDPASEPQSYAEFGSHVARILEAAEATAARIMSEAEEQAAAILREAEDAAAARREDAAGEANAIHAEAEEAARRVFADAESHAASSREAAEEMARRIAAAARKRQLEINQVSDELEARLRQMLDGARDVAAKLEVALGDREEYETETETLIDALNVDRRS